MAKSTKRPYVANSNDWTWTLLTESLPKKLKYDSISEAMFEARFDADPSSVPEILLGRLADNAEWRGFTTRRLPTADIPAAIRRADPNLRYQPAIDLINPDGTKIVRLGPQSLAYGRRAPYPGWDRAFGAEIGQAIDILFAVVPRVSATRLGLRYINTLRSDFHEISGIETLNLNIVIDAVAVTHNLNLNYTIPVSDNSSCTVRIATVEYALGQFPKTPP